MRIGASTAAARVATVAVVVASSSAAWLCGTAHAFVAVGPAALQRTTPHGGPARRQISFERHRHHGGMAPRVLDDGDKDVLRLRPFSSTALSLAAADAKDDDDDKKKKKKKIGFGFGGGGGGDDDEKKKKKKGLGFGVLSNFDDVMSEAEEALKAANDALAPPNQSAKDKEEAKKEEFQEALKAAKDALQSATDDEEEEEEAKEEETAPLTTAAADSGADGKPHFVNLKPSPPSEPPTATSNDDEQDIMELDMETEEEEEEDMELEQETEIYSEEEDELSLESLPVIDDWRINEDGQIIGIVTNHPTLIDGDVVCTSPLEYPERAKERTVAETTSGSRYQLGTKAKKTKIIGGGEKGALGGGGVGFGISDMSKEVKLLRDQLRLMRKEVSDANTRADAAEEACDVNVVDGKKEAAKDKEDVDEERTKLEAEVFSLQSLLEKANAEKAHFEKGLDKARTVAEQEKAQLEQKLQNAEEVHRKEQAELENKLAIAMSKHAEEMSTGKQVKAIAREEEKNKIDQLEREHDEELTKLKAQMEADRATLTEEVREELQDQFDAKRSELERELSTLKNSLDKTLLEVETLTSERTRLQQSIDQLKSEHAAELSNVRDNLDAEMSQLAASKAALEEERTSLMDEVRSDDDTRRELEKEIKTLRAYLREETKRKDSLMDELETAKREHAAELLNVQWKQRTDSTYEEQLEADYDEKRKELEREISQLKNKLEATDLDFVKMSSEQSKMQQTLDDERDLHKAEIAKWQDRMSDLLEQQSEKDAASSSGSSTAEAAAAAATTKDKGRAEEEAKEAAKQIKLLRASLDEAQRKQTSLEEELETANKDHAAQVADLEKNATAMASSQEMFDAAAASAAESQKEIIASLRRELDGARNEKTDLVAELAEMKKTVAAAATATATKAPRDDDGKGASSDVTALRAKLDESQRNQTVLQQRLDDESMQYAAQIMELKGALALAELKTRMESEKWEGANNATNLTSIDEKESSDALYWPASGQEQPDENADVATLQEALEKSRQSEAALRRSMEDQSEAHAAEMYDVKASVVVSLLRGALDDAKEEKVRLERALETERTTHAAQMAELRASTEKERIQWKADAEIHQFRGKLLEESNEKLARVEETLEGVNEKHAKEILQLKAAAEAERKKAEEGAELSSGLAATLDDMKQNQSKQEKALEDKNKEQAAQIATLNDTVAALRAQKDESDSAELAQLQAYLNEERDKYALLEQKLEDINQKHAQQLADLDTINKEQVAEQKAILDAERLQWNEEVELSTLRTTMLDEAKKDQAQLEEIMENERRTHKEQIEVANREHAAQIAQLENTMELERAQAREEAEARMLELRAAIESDRLQMQDEAEISNRRAAILEEAMQNQARLEQYLDEANRKIAGMAPFVVQGARIERDEMAILQAKLEDARQSRLRLEQDLDYSNRNPTARPDIERGVWGVNPQGMPIQPNAPDTFSNPPADDPFNSFGRSPQRDVG